MIFSIINKPLDFLRSNWKNVLFFALLFMLSLFLFYRCGYGFVSYDEACYFGTPYRIIQGDSLFWDEWHVNQMFSFPMLPIVYLVSILNPSMDGTYLIMRYIYTTVQILSSIFIYFSFRKFNSTGALFSCLCFLVYTPYNIMALGYNTICPLCLIISLTLLLTKNNNKIFSFISGLLFAFSVLCCPLLILAFLINWVLFLLQKKYHSKQLLSTIISFSIGCLFIALLFFYFVFSRISFPQFFQALPYILSDPNHDISSYNILSYFNYIWNSCPLTIGNTSLTISNIIILIYAFLFIVVLFDKGRKNHKFEYFNILCITTFTYLVCLVIVHQKINTIIFPINILAFFSIFLSSNIKIKKLFRYIWMPGIIYSYCLNLSSDQCFIAISSASIVALVGSISMLCLLVCELPRNRFINSILSKVICLLLISFQLFSECYFRYFNVFGDLNIDFSKYAEKITDGSLKGIRSSQYFFDTYNTISKDLSTLENDTSIETIAYFFGSPWFYIDTPSKRMGSFTSNSWYGYKYTLSQELNYYSINPSKKPDAAYFSYPNLYGDQYSDEKFATYYKTLFPEYHVITMNSGILLKK